MATRSQISRLVSPQSIAVVGASQAANKLAGQVIPALAQGGFKGRIYPINPRYEEVGGHRCYPSVAALPEPVDHCIIAVAKERVPAVLSECREKGVGSAAIFSSGYAETGTDGKSAQQALVEAAGDMPFIGPNCMGMVNLLDHVVAAPAPVFARDGAEMGDVALLSQSGGLAYATIAFFAVQQGMRFSYVVNTGNSAGVSFTDLIDFVNRDDATRVILAVAESEAVVAEIVQASRRFGLPKPIVLLKLGRGETGARMALSHTGSLAGDYRLVRDLAEQHGIICADDIDEALGIADLVRRGFTAANADGIAALSISGGNVTLFADQADAYGLTSAELDPAIEARLGTVLPDYISVHNPIDITALGYEQPELHSQVFDVLIEDASVRTLVPIITTAVDYTPVCVQLADLKQRTGASLIALWTGGSYESRSKDILREADIPIFHSAGTLARSLAAMKRARPTAKEETPQHERNGLALPDGAGPLRESESLAFLQQGGVPVPRWRLCPPTELAAACKEVGYPVVIKADADETHISDRGGVILGITDEIALNEAGPRIDALAGGQLLVSQFLPGEELIVSSFEHPDFGLVMMIGSGGRLTELVKDVAFIALPASRETVRATLTRTLIGNALAKGFRGMTGFEAALEFLERFADLAMASRGVVSQIELNPVTVGPHGAAAVDAAVQRAR